VVSQAGSEDGVLHLIDAGSGRALPDVIDRGGFASVGWLPDETGFFYTRTAKLAPGAPQAEKLKHLKVFLHRLGDDLDTDRMVLDGDHLPFAFASELALPSIAVPPGTGRALAVIANGTQPEQSIYQAPLADLLAGHAAWTSIADQADGVSAWAAQGRRIYLLTHKNAARYRVVAEDFNTPGFAAARTMVPEARGVLTAIVASSEALYVAERDGGGMNLYRLPHGGSKRETVATPFKGTIYPPTDGDGGALYADPLAPGAAFALESWARAPQWFVYAPGRGAATDTGVIPPFSRDLSAYETTETQVTSPDGAVVPLSIVHRRGLKLDGARPTLLEGYGNFAVPMDPTFRPSVLTWLDHGGVYAMAHVRGGGELGEPWHRGGMLTAKANSVTDFIACAEALIARGYTSPPHLAAEGSSGGGLTVGDAAARRPELFRAIVLRVPGVNPLRFEQLRVGPALVSEYGSVTNAEQVRTLMAVDPYANLKDGVSYPAALITAGFNDPRILPWMPAKFAARLQAASSSGRPVLLRVEFEGGHGPGSTAAQGLAERADEYAFLLWQLGADSAGRH
jgi:prolyl oligopeptidase